MSCKQILPVPVLPHRLGERGELRNVDVSHPERHLFHAGDLQALPLLDRLDERPGFQQGVVRPGVQPGEPAAEQFTCNDPVPDRR